MRIIALALMAGLVAGPAAAERPRPTCHRISVTEAAVQRTTYTRIPALVEERTVTRVRLDCAGEIQTEVTRTPWVDVSGPR